MGLRSVRFLAVPDMSAQAPLDWLRRAAGRAPLVVAHRGASAAAPENTLAAFDLALEQGARFVECDVHLSADGVPVVIHDETVDRTTDGGGSVADLTLAQLQALDAGRWLGPRFAGQSIPTLDATLALCAGKARVFVELKRGGGQALVDSALASIAASACDVAVISFGPDEVSAVAKSRADLPLGFLVGRGRVLAHGVPSVLTAATEMGATFISPQHDVVDAAFVILAQRANLPVSVWTVDDPGRMNALSDLGVDAVTTNRPDLALKVFS